MPGGLLDMFGVDPVANRQTRQRENMLEKQIAAELLRQKLANQGQLDVQSLQNTGQLGVEKVRGRNQIGNTRAQGDESRKTQASAADINRAFEVLRSANLMTEAEQAQKLRIMEKDGIVSNKQNDKVYDQATSDMRIRKALQSDAQEVEARSAPGYQQSLNAGMQAANLTPAFANMRTGAMSVGPGDMLLAPPSGASLPPSDLNQFNQAQGAGMSEVINMVGGIPNPETGQMQFQSPEVTRVQTPGRVRINPAIQQQVMQMQQPTPVASAPAPNEPSLGSIMEMLKRMRLDPNAGARSY